MSRYTTELRYLIENPEWTQERLGMSTYPIFDESYRATLNQKIINHFYFDEIGSETPARFGNRMNNRLWEIMPYYNQLYISAMKDINPFITMRYTTHGVENLLELLQIIRDKTRDLSDNKDTADTSDSTTNTVSHDNINSQDGGVDTKHSVTDTDKTGTLERNTKEQNSSNVDEEKNGQTIHSDKDIVKTEYNSGTKTHGFDVHSDTPEGFMATDSIEKNTYASSADKNRQNTDRDGNDTTTTTYGHHINTTDDRSVDTVENKEGLVKDNTTDNTDTDYTETTDYGKSNDTNKWGTVDVNGNARNVGSLTDIVNEIIKEIENHERNKYTDTVTDYDGFNSTTMSEMLLKWRDTFLNIDMMILKDLEILFIGVLN